MNTILCLGIILVGALVAEKIISYLKIPAITSYILLGILLGPNVLNVTGGDLTAFSELLSHIVLGFIAFQIGKNFSVENFKRIGKTVLSISLSETLGACICVTAGIYYLANQPFCVALMFGAISAATAPATTMMVIRQYKARGLFTDVLLGTVAIDDAWGIMIFSISLAIAQTIQIGQFSELIIMAVMVKAAGKIFLSVILGSIMAFLVSRVSVYLKRREHMLTFILGVILINTGIALYFHLSPLLSNMFFGAMLVNLEKTAFKFFKSMNTIDWPFYVIFYVLAGAHLDVELLSTLGIIGSIYIILRVTGKVGGAFAGAVIARADISIRKYMGLSLLPQAGVAIGLAMIAKANLPHIGGVILNTIIATTVVFEILGPLATRYSLSKAKEI